MTSSKRICLLLAISLVLYTNCSAKSASKLALCKNKNPFLQEFNNTDVLHPFKVWVFDSPIKRNFEHCKSEWDPNGSCCDQDQLVIYSMADSLLIEEYSKHFQSFSNYIVKAVTSAFKVTTPITQTPDFQALLARSKASTFDKDTDECWNFMKSLRGSSLCSTCSGRAENFFKKGKILISPETCKTAIDKCEKFFRAVPQLLKDAESIQKVVATLADKDAKTYAAKASELAKILPPPRRLMNAFQAYDKHRSEQDHNMATLFAAKVCSMFVNIKKDPYIKIQSEAVVRRLKAFMEQSKNQQYKVDLLHADQFFKRLADSVHGKRVKEVDERNARLQREIQEIQRNMKMSQKAKNDRINQLKKDADKDIKNIHIKWDNEYKAAVNKRNEQKRDADHYKKEKEARKNNLSLKILTNWKGTEAKNNLPRKLFLDQLQNGNFADLFIADSSVLVIVDGDQANHMVNEIRGVTFEGSNSRLRPVNISLAFP